jgi:hypothetical protein
MKIRHMVRAGAVSCGLCAAICGMVQRRVDCLRQQELEVATMLKFCNQALVLQLRHTRLFDGQYGLQTDRK